MSKKSKKHAVKTTGEKKMPRISVMEKQKKDRQKLYLILSLTAIVVLGVGITIGAILGGGNKPASEKFELENGHFTQRDGYFEMDIPPAWGMFNKIVDIAPYGLDKVPNPYAFIPSGYKTLEQGDSETKIAKASPNNILFTIVPKDFSTATAEGFLTDQNVLGDQNIVDYLRKSAQTSGRKLKNCTGWVLGEKPEQKVTSSSFVGLIKTGENEIFFTAKFADTEDRTAILKALDSIKTATPAPLDAYTDEQGSIMIPKPTGWIIDTSSQELMMHQVVSGSGALFYPEGSKTSYNMSPTEVQKSIDKSGNPEGKQVANSISLPMPLANYIAVYTLGGKPNPANMNSLFRQFVGFAQDLKITAPYDWIADNISKKGLSMVNCPGKYFISEIPVKIMQVKPKQSLFASIDTPTGTVLIMAGWTNDDSRKAIIDTLNKIKVIAK